MLRALLLSTALVLPAAPAMAQTRDHSAMHAEHHGGQITLSATGEVRAAPDMATVSAGVVTQAESAAEALRANNRQMNGVFDALARAGIERADIQTSNLSINPVWSNYNGNEERRITGYQATNTVTARVSDLDNLGQTIDALVGSGANQIQGVNFMLEDRNASLREARLQAVTELRELANLYAGALGVELGRIIEFSESTGGGFQPPVMYAARNMAMDESTQVAGGQVGVSVTVTASFAIVE